MNKKKSKLMLIAVIGALFVLVGAGIVRCVYQGMSKPQGSPDQSAETTTNDETQTSEEDAVPDDVTVEPRVDTQTARAVRGYYDTRWSANEGYNELIFLGDCFVEVLGTQNLPVFYTLESASDADGKLTLDVHAHYQTGEIGADCTIVIDYSAQNPTITSDAFTYSNTYELTPTKPNSVRVDNLSEELINYFDIVPDALIAMVSDYAAEHNISDNDSFAWTGEVRTDSADESRVATFKGDDPAATIITVTRDKFGWFSVS